MPTNTLLEMLENGIVVITLKNGKMFVSTRSQTDIPQKISIINNLIMWDSNVIPVFCLNTGNVMCFNREEIVKYESA